MSCTRPWLGDLINMVLLLVIMLSLFDRDYDKLSTNICCPTRVPSYNKYKFCYKLCRQEC